MPGRHARMANGTRRSCARPGSHSSGRKRPCAPTSMGASVRWPVTSSASAVPASRTVRPRTTRPQQGRRYLPCRWAAPRALGRSERSVGPSPVSSSGARRPRRATPPDRHACSREPLRSWQRTKPWSAIGSFPADSSRREVGNAMASALLSTLRRGGLPSRRIAGRGASPSVAHGSAPSRGPTRAAPWLRRHRTATRAGSSLLVQHPWGSTRRCGTMWSAPMLSRARRHAAQRSAMIRPLPSRSSCILRCR